MALVKLKNLQGKNVVLVADKIIGYQENAEGNIEVYTTSNDVFEVREGHQAVGKRLTAALAGQAAE